MSFSPLSVIAPHIDAWGLIADATGDGGDTCQREGMFAFAGAVMFNKGYISKQELDAIRERYKQSLKTLECPNSKGDLMRHANPDRWWSDCGGLEHPLQPWKWTSRLSRDQLSPHMPAMAMLGLKDELRRLWWAQGKRLFLFTTNTRHNGQYMNKEEHLRKSPDPWEPGWKLPDLLGPTFLASAIRAFRMLPLYPLLFILDLELLINAAIKTFWYAKNPNKSDDVNIVVNVMFARYVMPTPVSFLARLIYSHRPKAAPPPLTGLYLSDFGPQTALDHYFMRVPPMSPLNHLYRLITDDLKP